VKPLLSVDIPTAVIASVASLNLDLREWQRNKRIGEVLTSTVLKGGKRLRPLVTFLMGDLFGVSHDEIAPYARVVELVHASTLAHDDVIDNAVVRRGEPSINALSSNKRAVLAGDYLLAYVLDTVSSLGNPRIVRELARIISDLAEGEWLQLENAEKEPLTRGDIEQVALKKTGSVLRWACVVPAILAEASADHIEMAAELGETIGIAFQITDDILDCKRPDEARLADFKNGVVNSVLYEMISQGGYQRGSDDLSQVSSKAVESAIAAVQVRLGELIARARFLIAGLADGLSVAGHPAGDSAVRAMSYLIDYLEDRV
jgi:octaprenyl-diphosphate synthase